ncbi:3-phosphoserine/phosphohydroxythreonine transaminase [Candidatus Poribacteria bacterium]|nr:3-phosphoserine/phosphohydroxythreonine transaminase [Candidatus Poribacteria bacterium]
MTKKRIVNFSAGPAALPLEVLEEAAEGLVSFGNTGIGIAEHSHRGKAFVAVLEETMALCRELLGMGDEHAVLFLQGGASSQFFMVPQNFLQGGTANYIDTGEWSSKAMKEAKAFGTVHCAASSKDSNYTFIPKEHTFVDGAKYTHFTSNNTIFGTQFRTEPVTSAPLVCDASSDIMSRPMDMSKYALVYAGAQKNLGPSGVTLVLIRKDFAETGPQNIPVMLQYRTHIKGDSCYNTPPTFGIYLMNLVFKWMKNQGGLKAIEKLNVRKANVLYDCLDSSDFWRTPVVKEDRSLMNVVWRLPSEELEEKLIKEATAAGFSGLKGHRSVGGLRASIYNAVPEQGIRDLVEFMKDFERKNG